MERLPAPNPAAATANRQRRRRSGFQPLSARARNARFPSHKPSFPCGTTAPHLESGWKPLPPSAVAAAIDPSQSPTLPPSSRHFHPRSPTPPGGRRHRKQHLPHLSPPERPLDRRQRHPDHQRLNRRPIARRPCRQDARDHRPRVGHLPRHLRQFRRQRSCPSADRPGRTAAARAAWSRPGKPRRCGQACRPRHSTSSSDVLHGCQILSARSFQLGGPAGVTAPCQTISMPSSVGCPVNWRAGL